MTKKTDSRKIPDNTLKPPLTARLWLLFATFFKIALFVVGGGLAMLPVIESVFVRRGLLKNEETLDMVVLTQTVPGLVAANSAVFVGTKIAGFWGAAAALAGAILPSVLIIVAIAALFPDLTADNPAVLGAFTGIRAGITAVLAVTLCRLAGKIVKRVLDAFFALTAFLLLLWGINPVFVIIGAMPTGYAYLLWQTHRRLKKASRGDNI